jgi:hypothetical protein
VCVVASVLSYVCACRKRGDLYYGVTLDTFTKFLSTKAADKFCKLNADVLRLQPDQILYMPKGCIYYMTQYEKLAKKEPPKVQVAWHLPLGGSFSKGVSPPEFATALLTLNKEVFSAKTGTMWKEREAFYTASFE